MDDATLLARHWAGLAHFQRTVGRDIPGARVIEGAGWVGAVVPSAPHAALVNAVVAEDPTAIPDALDGIAHEYRSAGVRRWGVFVDADALATTDALANAGLKLDSMPSAMGRELSEEEEDRVAANGHPPTDLPTVGRVNDAAYGLPPGRLADVIAALPPAIGTAYGAPAPARRGARASGDPEAPAAVLLAGRHGRDAPIWFVATLPHARRRGLATGLLTLALRHARRDGCVTSTLQASAQGERLYRRLGYRRLGEVHLWERRV